MELQMTQYKRKFDPQLILMSEPWSRAYRTLNNHPTKFIKQLRKFHKWFGWLPQSIIKNYLTR